jgi:glycosyltransferase involved in cell wall biosynthesis
MTPVRVCMLVRNDCRTDYRVLKEAGSLARAGLEVTVVAVNTYGPLEREERDGFRIIRVPVTWSKSKVIKGLNLFPRAIWRMVSVAKQIAADVYHAHDSDAILPVWLATSQIPGAKLLYDAHEVGFLSFRESLSRRTTPDVLPIPLVNWIWSRLNDWIVSHRADAVITVNEPLAVLLARHYRIPRPAVVMNCPPRFKATPEAQPTLSRMIGVAPETPIIVSHGAFSQARHGRGAENLVLCAPRLRRGVVVLLGYGSQYEALRQLAGRPELVGRVFVLPSVPPSELLTHLCGASIGVIPTELWHPRLRYSSPNKFFEYLAVGLPVVTSDMPLVRQICDDYGCGLVCDPGMQTSIADAVNRLLDDAHLYASMRAGAWRAAEVYNWESQEQVLLGVYQQLLSGHRQRQ